jgi:TonB family protein
MLEECRELTKRKNAIHPCLKTRVKCPPKPPEPLRPKVLVRVVPQYPYLSLSSSVTLRMEVEADGTVGDIRLVDARHLSFCLNAVEAAKRMRFRPIKRNGVAMATTIPYRFVFLK